MVDHWESNERNRIACGHGNKKKARKGGQILGREVTGGGSQKHEINVNQCETLKDEGEKTASRKKKRDKSKRRGNRAFRSEREMGESVQFLWGRGKMTFSRGVHHRGVRDRKGSN